MYVNLKMLLNDTLYNRASPPRIIGTVPWFTLSGRRTCNCDSVYYGTEAQSSDGNNYNPNSYKSVFTRELKASII